MNIKAIIIEGGNGSAAVRADITAGGFGGGVVHLVDEDGDGNYRKWDGHGDLWAAPSVIRWLDTLDDAPAVVAKIERVVTGAARLVPAISAPPAPPRDRRVLITDSGQDGDTERDIALCQWQDGAYGLDWCLIRSGELITPEAWPDNYRWHEMPGRADGGGR